MTAPRDPTTALSPNTGHHRPLKAQTEHPGRTLSTRSPHPFPPGPWGAPPPGTPLPVRKLALAFPPLFPNVPGLIRSRSCFCTTFWGPAVANLCSNVRAAGSFLVPAVAPPPCPQRSGAAGNATWSFMDQMVAVGTCRNALGAGFDLKKIHPLKSRYIITPPTPHPQSFPSSTTGPGATGTSWRRGNIHRDRQGQVP